MCELKLHLCWWEWEWEYSWCTTHISMPDDVPFPPPLEKKTECKKASSLLQETRVHGKEREREQGRVSPSIFYLMSAL